MENNQLYNTDAERNVLKSILQNRDFCKSVFMFKTIIADHFVDLFHRDLFNAVDNYFIRFGIQPTMDKLKIHMLKFITYNQKFKTNEQQRKIWLKGVERLYNPLDEMELAEKESNVELLEELRKARLIQKFFVGAEKSFGDKKYEEVISLMGEVISVSKVVDNVINEGNIVDDFKQHIQIIRQQRLGEIQPVKTGIVGAQENDETGAYHLVYLDDYLGGGLYPAEMTLIIGENNVGKSFMLMESTVQASMNQKLNSILFTIEMNKIKQQNRIYSRITGIPYNKFRLGTITQKELTKWKDKLQWWKENCGILHVVSFDKGATVMDIENKIKDAENKYGQDFGLISIDYLNDMKPMGKFQSSKGWDAMGEISWDLSNMAKKWNNRKGIPVITANQKKTTKAGSGGTSWDDAAFSPLPVQHATVGIGIGQSKVDEEIGRIQWTLFKNRDGEKSVSFYTYPDFSVSRIASKNKMYTYYDIKES